jgi:3-methylfumaryl-CoA hydratase
MGRMTTKRTEVLSTTEKEGRSGRLHIVVVRHTISQDGERKIVEQQDLVYREVVVKASPATAESSSRVVPTEANEWSLPIDATLLFRFSALTYNAHRIHYDRDYARDVEGYPGLVTHGPLQALAMAECVRRKGYVATALDYRLVAPLFDHQGLVARATACDSGHSVSVRDTGGRVTAQGQVKVRRNKA